MSDPFNTSIQDWLFRISPCTGDAPIGILVACHGWTGNEISMDIFTHNKLNQFFWVIFPRAPYGTAQNGYSWVQNHNGYLQDFQSLALIAQELEERLTILLKENNLPHLPLHWMGFSQGSALALTHSVIFLQPGAKIGLLSGFLPIGLSPSPGKLRRNSYFVAHGNADIIVPVDCARETVRYLEASDARVDYCESNAGHKLQASCFRQLENFFLSDQPKSSYFP